MPVPVKIPAHTFTYAVLLKTIRAEIAKTQQIIERQQTLTYWNVGRTISQYVLEGKDRARYGAKVYEKLSEDLDMSVTTLERVVRFSRDFPIPAPEPKLSWTDYKTLLAVKDPAKRAEFMKRVESENINTKQLRREVAQFNVRIKAKSQVKPDLFVQLPVARGKLYTYQVIYSASLPVQDVPYIDLGFNPSGNSPPLFKAGMRADSRNGVSGQCFAPTALETVSTTGVNPWESIFPNLPCYTEQKEIR